ncbi:PKD domain-containing protein [Taibaiella chishuiensis]|uniref:Putative secreted protein (Por secretion system target) n=1 Tax=Taibaiella chishuiensis TaxID=1434707 RepID=A0A2P8CYR6_9BACT|nr:PKD domain-containing protein [Taibaiella chishuiensis]PSK90111.1 putative secreted protein (Por secretion system target) [Taibaiella chishuiensis]
MRLPLLSFLFFLLSGAAQLYATTSPSMGQKQYRWRNNDGSESAATWRAAVNTAVTITSSADILRLRIELANTGTAAATVTETLEYSANGGTTWTIMNTPATNAFTYQTSTFVTNGAATTNQMGTGTAGTFAAGRIVSNPGTAATLADGARTEYEWVITPTANIVPGTTYTFRSTGQQATPTVYPTLTMAVVACTGTPTAGTTNAAATSLVCGNTTQLSLSGNTVSTGISYQWQYNVSGTWVNFGTNANTQTSPPVTATSTQFRCMLTCTSTGGGSAASAPVTVLTTPPPLNIGNDTTICPGVTYVIDAGANPGGTYLWNTGATTQTITTGAAGIYSVLVTRANGCNLSDSRTITAGVVPQNNLPATTDLCEGETANLNAGNTGSTFLWSPGGATTQTINVTTGGTKSVAIKSNTGCMLNSSTNVVMRPLPVVNLGVDTNICIGAQIVLDAGNPAHTYLWTPTGATTQTINVTDSGTYHVSVKTAYGCEATDKKHVGFLPAPYVQGFNFIPLFYENLGKVKFVALNPGSTITGYLWDFGDGSPASTQVEPVHTYAAAGHYTVSLKVTNECSTYTTSLVIHVDNITGISIPETEAASVSLFPNPSRGSLVIESRDAALQLQSVKLINMVGAVVYEQTLKGSRQQLQVGHLPSGIYSVYLLTNKGPLVRKLELQH